MSRDLDRHFSSAAAKNEPRQRLLAWLIALALSPVGGVAAHGADPGGAAPASADADSDYQEFSGSFVSSTSRDVDVSRFERGNPVLPGTYLIDLYVNDIRIARDSVTFRAVDGQDTARPCFTYSMLQKMGVDIGKLDASVVNAQNDCVGIRDISPDARAVMDMNDLRLNVSVPQAFMRGDARGYVSPDLWDAGQTAFLLGYNANVYRSRQNVSSTQAYGMATDLAGARVPVQGGTYYIQTAPGVYAPSPNGNYALGVDGSYVPVQGGSYTAPAHRNSTTTNSSGYLGLNMGFNVAGWRVRSQENMQWSQGSGTRWNNIGVTASHDITPWKAQFTAGDGYTQGALFNSTGYRGFSVYSDDRMLPQSQTGYAPVVRGVANSQARIEIRQNRNLLLETTVAPGPFVINDLYATGYGGDLTVTVFEADGSTHSFVVPYAAVPQLLRPGVDRWSLTAGQVRNVSSGNDTPMFLEGTYQRGLNNFMTAYGGVQATNQGLYKALMAGAAINTPVGAFAIDMTGSNTRLRGASAQSGYSSRMTYSKSIPNTDTTFALASYRYSNGNFYTLSDAVQAQNYTNGHNALYGVLGRSKNSMQVTINQSFGPRYGSLYLTGSSTTYWNGTQNSSTYQLGYNGSYERIGFGITAGRTYSSSPMFAGSRYDNQYGINVSIPLGGASSGGPMFTASADRSDGSGNTGRANVTGNLGDNSQYNYSAYANYARTPGSGSSTSWGGNGGWQAPYGTLNAGYSRSNGYQQGSLSAMGGVVVHGGGVTLAPYLNPDGAVGIIDAPGAQGASVSSGQQGKVDGRGYAVATNLIPYRMNDITLDPKGSSADVELETTRVQVAPRAGAVVPLNFNTQTGRAVLIRVDRAGGEALPFGAEVFNDKGQSIGTVGQGGQVFVRGAEHGGELTVRWGDAEDQQCRLKYALPERIKGDSTMPTVSVMCAKPGDSNS